MVASCWSSPTALLAMRGRTDGRTDGRQLLLNVYLFCRNATKEMQILSSQKPELNVSRNVE